MGTILAVTLSAAFTGLIIFVLALYFKYQKDKKKFSSIANNVGNAELDYQDEYEEDFEYRLRSGTRPVMSSIRIDRNIPYVSREIDDDDYDTMGSFITDDDLDDIETSYKATSSIRNGAWEVTEAVASVFSSSNSYSGSSDYSSSSSYDYDSSDYGDWD